MASCMSLAATDESTPPETAPNTRPLGPTNARIRVISLSMNASYPVISSACQERGFRTIVQFFEHPQIPITNLSSTSFPLGECVTSGWN